MSLKTAFNVNHPCTNGMDEKSIFLLCVVGGGVDPISKSRRTTFAGGFHTGFHVSMTHLQK